MSVTTVIGEHLSHNPFRAITGTIGAGVGVILPLSAGLVVSTHLPSAPTPLHTAWQFGVVVSALTTAYFAGRNTRREFLSTFDKLADRPVDATPASSSEALLPKG